MDHWLGLRRIGNDGVVFELGLEVCFLWELLDLFLFGLSDGLLGVAVVLLPAPLLTTSVENHIPKLKDESLEVILVDNDVDLFIRADKSILGDVMLGHDLTEGVSPVEVPKIRARDGGLDPWSLGDASTAGVDQVNWAADFLQEEFVPEELVLSIREAKPICELL